MNGDGIAAAAAAASPASRPGSTARRRSKRARIEEPGEQERRPLLDRSHFTHSLDGEQFFSCNPNAHAHLPVYTNIHRIRRDIILIVEDYLTLEQLRDLRLNIQVIRPLVDKLYELDDVSIGTHLGNAIPLPNSSTADHFWYHQLGWYL